MLKVIITIINGTVDILQKPNDVEVEIRDYDVDGNWDAESLSCRVDPDSDRYQEIIFPVEGKKTPIKKVELNYTNYYQCSNCHTSWQDEWDCVCDDRCPKCNTTTSPYKSEDL